MDTAKVGTENQARVQVTPRPRPPILAKKPKPALPKKPTVEVKESEDHPEPENCEKQNGNVPVEHAAQVPSVSQATTTTTQPSSVAPSTGVFPPAKAPPPPLPKTPPKGRPSVTKTPPPLPKAPPAGRASVKPKPPQKSVPAQVSSDVTDKNVSQSGASENVCNSEKATLRVENDTHNCDSQIASQNSNDKKVKDDDFKFSNLRSKFVPTSPAVSSKPSRPAASPKGSPRLPLKPKPRTVNRNTTIGSPSPDKNSPVSDNVQSDLQQGTSSSRSTWFVSNEICNEQTSDLDSASGSNDSLQQSSEVHIKVGKGEDARSSVKFRKKPSPVVPRKPLPKIPAKKSTISSPNTDSKEKVESVSIDSSRCDNKSFDSSKTLSPAEIKGSKDAAFHKPVESEGINHKIGSRVAACTLQGDKVSLQDEHHSAEVFSSDKVVPEAYPKPTPRKPTPAARPRPAPRKRLSLNRLSETEESLSNQLKLHATESKNNAGTGLIKAKSEDNVNRSNHEFDYVTKSIDIDDSVGKSSSDHGKHDMESSAIVSCDKEGESKPSSKVNSLVKSRVVYSDVGEEKQYRVIDKSIIKTQRHVTELDNDDEVVVLRKSGTGEDSNSGPTVSDIKNKFNNIESDSPKFAQKHVSNVNSIKGSTISPEKDKCDISDVDSPKNRENNNDVIKSVDGSPSSRDSFDDLLTDCSLLEPTSLLNEIEEILTRSYKYSSLTRSGSSPEKKSSPMLPRLADIKHERSKSCDNDNSPVRPPRPKRELKKLRSRSQITYDSCGSDTESLPETSLFNDEQFSSLKSNKAHTLGPAKPHPPKPKRNKLMKVQRSQSDVTAMKAFLDSQERKDLYNHKRQISDAGPPSMMEQRNSCDLSGVNINDGKGGNRPKSWKPGLRPSRKAPPPPSVPPLKVTPPSPAVDINTVVPLDIRVKSMNLDDRKGVRNSKELSTEKSDNKKKMVRNSYGSLYQSINDEGIDDYSDDEHDYHEIPDEMEKADSGCVSTESSINVSGMVKPSNGPGRGKLRSPPKLPPRNLNNSQSFETSSLSSTGHDFDSAVTGCASSLEDVSISSCKVYPKTSSPNVPGNDKPGVEISSGPGRPGSVSLSESSDGMKKRPVSGISIQSDSGSGSQVTERVSSSESEEEDEAKIARKKEKKLFRIAQEVASSERVFVDVLSLLNVDFRKHIAMATEEIGRPVIPSEMLNRILDYLPQLQNFNEELLKDLDERISTWDKQPGIANIFVKKGPFLKLYSSYIRDFETMNSALDEALKKYPAFATALKEFEKSPRCACLALKHYMLKPIQRIPQYKMLLTDYMKHLAPDSAEMKDTQTALVIVSEVAQHANENMRHGDYVQKMLEIQRSLIGQFEVIKPGRIFLKEGELMKLSRKEMQPRFFFLFNDMLLYTTPVATGYRLNNALPLAGMRINESSQDDYKMEFSIITEQRSFTLHGTTLEERDDWVTALNSAIQENAQKRGTFESVRAGAQAMIDKDFVLGDKCPLWIPDARVTMCMLCTCEFTLTWRRHHCRACGRIVCGNCSDNEAPLRYLKYKQKRVCDECYKTLVTESVDGAVDKDSSSVKEEEESSFLGGLFERFVKPRRSGRTEKKNFSFRPERLVEVNADDEGARISGYLHRLDKGKKWKKMWYIIKDNALYWFKASKDRAAENSMALLGYEVARFTDYFEGVESSLLFQLSHSNMEPVVFRTDSAATTERWVTVMREASLV